MRIALVPLLLTSVLAARRKARSGRGGGRSPPQRQTGTRQKEGKGSSPWVEPSACSPQELFVVQGRESLCGTLSLNVDLCGQVQNKTPGIQEGLWNGPSEEKRLTDETKRAFEHRLGVSLAKSQAVVETTREFGRRVYNLILKKATMEAFAKECSVHNTGFAGVEPDIIKQVLTVDGNLREVFGLVYCLAGNAAVIDGIFESADQETLEGILGPAAGQLAWKAAELRGKEVKESKNISDKWTWGVPDYTFPSQDSWVRFNFGASLPGGTELWMGARQGQKCLQTELKTNSPDLYPPLSQREITAQCGNEPLPCRLKWYPGKGCYTLSEDNVYIQRAEHFGYRTVAGPSGTTAKVLQLALLLGFAPEDMPALRATMLGWMLPADDHSVVEIMLAAQPFIEKGSGQPDCGMQWGVESGQDGLADMLKIWPEGLLLESSWGPQLQGPDATWLQKAANFDSKAGRRGRSVSWMLMIVSTAVTVMGHKVQ